MADPAYAGEPDTDVRTCAKCGHAALVCLNAWKHSVNGISSGSVTRECRCQSCGTFVKLRDPRVILTERVLGYVFLLALVPGLVMLWRARRHRLAWLLNPPAPGAVRPEIRYQVGPGDRRCASCGGTATIVGQTRHTHNGVPTGTEYDYACKSCAKKFQTESAGGIAINVLAGGVATMIGVVSARSSLSAGWRFGLGGVFLLAGIAAVWKAAEHLLAALNNPRLS